MLNFDFKRSSRKCCRSERVLLPGEEFYSALVEVDGATERQDYCQDVWESPPENCIGWWKSKVPEVDKGRIYWAPRNVLLAYFDHISSQSAQADIAYVTALLLIQKKILTLEESIEGGDSQTLELRNRKANQNYQLRVVEIASQRMAEIQDELAERLFMDQPYESDDEQEGEASGFEELETE